MERRTLFKGIAAAGAGIAATGIAARAETQSSTAGTALPSPAPDYADHGAAGLPRLTDPGERRGDMLYRRFGRTGASVSAIGFGGSHFTNPGISEAESIRLCHAAIAGGITFMDNSWDYNQGVSESRMGRALAGGYREKVFLMTKADGRTKQLAAEQLNDSLRRLRTDHIDLWQFHEVLRFDDPDRIFAPGGAIEAALEARQAGKIRFIGFTGHKDPHIHLYMLEVAARHGFHFDAVLMPSNVMDAHFRSFAHQVMPVALAQGIAVQTMKPFGGGPGVILKANTGITPTECLHYALNLPTSVVITGIDNQQVLDQALAAVRSFRPMDEQQVAALLAKTEQAAQFGAYELFKTTAHFDGTARNADWLGGESPAVEKLVPNGSG